MKDKHKLGLFINGKKIANVKPVIINLAKDEVLTTQQLFDKHNGNPSLKQVQKWNYSRMLEVLISAKLFGLNSTIERLEIIHKSINK